MQHKVRNVYSKKQQFTTGLRKKHMEWKIFPYFTVLSPEQYSHMKNLNQDHKQNHVKKIESIESDLLTL